jgi:hypothetical protein
MIVPDVSHGRMNALDGLNFRSCASPERSRSCAETPLGETCAIHHHALDVSLIQIVRCVLVSSLIRNDDQLTGANRETDAHRANQLRSATYEQEVLETIRDACRLRVLDVNLLSQTQSAKNAEVSLATNRDACRHLLLVVSLLSQMQNVKSAVVGRPRICVPDARRVKRSGVVCESLELHRWHHPCGGLPWRAERQS